MATVSSAAPRLAADPAPVLTLTAASRLMEHSQAGFPVDAAHPIAVVHDAQGAPMVFSLSSDPVPQLYAIVHQPGARTGWTQLDLSAELGVSATGFAVDQGVDGTLTLALASGNRLFLTGPLPHDTGAPPWTTWSGQWTERSSGAADTITELLLGTGGDLQPGAAAGDGTRPPLVAATAGAGGPQRWLVNADLTDSTWTWKLVHMAVDADLILDVAMGQTDDGPGLYTLSRQQGAAALELVWTTFPDDYGQSFNVALSAPPGAAALAVLPGDDGNTDLYVAGAGLYAFPVDAQTRAAQATTIADAFALPGLTELAVRRDTGGNVSVWALAGGDVKYLTRDGTGAWSMALGLSTGAAQIAPRRNQQLDANELFVVGADAGLAYFSQDPGTTVWRGIDVVLEQTDQLAEYTAYATQVNVTDADGIPQLGAPVTVAASSWCQVVVDGAGYVLDGRTPVALTTDARGTVTIVLKVDSIAAPTFTVTAGATALTVDPSDDIRDGLRGVTAETLTGTTLPDGTLLVDPAYTANAGTAAAAVSALVSATDHLAGGTAASTGAGPSLWAVSTDTGAATFHDDADTRTSILPAYLPDAGSGDFSLTTVPRSSAISAGGILHHLEQGFDKLKRLIVHAVEDGVEFLVDLGDKIAHFVVHTVETAVRGIAWLFHELICVDLPKLLKWLGFILDWGDIKETHKVLVNIADQAIEYFRSEVVALEGRIDDHIEDLKTKLHGLAGLPADAAATTVASARAQASPDGEKTVEHARRPDVNFTQYQVLHGGVLDAKVNQNDITDDLASQIGTWLTQQVIPAAEEIGDGIKTLCQGLRDDIVAGTLTMQDAFDRIVQSGLMDGLLDLAKAIVDIALEFVEDLLELLRQALDAPIKVPILSALYRKLAGAEPTVLDVLALVFSIPATILYKLTTGTAPFHDDAYGLDDPTPGAAFALLTEGASTEATGSADGTRVSKGEKVYSLVGGLPYDVSNATNSFLKWRQFQIATPDDEAAPVTDAGRLATAGSLLSLGRWSLGCEIIALATSFPVGDSDTKAGVWFERGAWFVLGAQAVKDGIWLVLAQRGSGPGRGRRCGEEHGRRHSVGGGRLARDRRRARLLRLHVLRGSGRPRQRLADGLQVHLQPAPGGERRPRRRGRLLPGRERGHRFDQSRPARGPRAEPPRSTSR